MEYKSYLVITIFEVLFQNNQKWYFMFFGGRLCEFFLAYLLIQ